MEQKTYLKIPLERVGVLIGPKGKIKKRIEKNFGVTLKIDSISGYVEIILEPETEDIMTLFTVQKIVRAIGRGFNPRTAEKLADEDFDLIIIELEDYVGRSKNAIARVKGRIIGKNGRSRILMEELTGTLISVYGHTVAAIGTVNSLNAVREALHMLIKGAFHKTVWNFIISYRRKTKKEREQLWDEVPEPKVSLSEEK